MKTFTLEDVSRLADAQKEINELRKFVIERATLHATLHPNERPAGLQGKFPETSYAWGSHLTVHESHLLSPTVSFYPIYEVDTGPGGGGEQVVYQVPRDFVYSVEQTEQEKRFLLYQSLKAEFESVEKASAATPSTPKAAVPTLPVTKTCLFQGYGPDCGARVVDGTIYCTKHAGAKCITCGNNANHECTHEGQFVCGNPVCPDHTFCKHHTRQQRIPFQP